MTSPLWTRTELLSMRNRWKSAYLAASTGKSYTIEGRTLTRQNIDEIRKQLEYFQQQLEALDGKRGPFFVTARPRR